MAYVIVTRHGLKADLPAAAPIGELFVTTDTHELFAGTGSGMAQVASPGGGGGGGGSGDAISIQGVPVLSQAPADGEILIFDQASGKYVPADPVVSGPDAPGAVPTRPPVQVGVFDGTHVQRLRSDTSGNVGVNVQNFPATQPVSAASLPLPAGAATSAKQPALGTAGSASADILTVQGKASMTPLLVDGSGVTQPVSAAALPLPTGAATEASLGTDGATPPSIPGTGIRGWLRSIYDKLAGTLAVSGTFWQATQPVSAASLPLPAGAATAAKQPALGTAGSASADVLTVQGKASMTPLLVDGSGVTQPVSAASLPLPTGAATEASLGTDGATPPTIPGTGIRGWLRSIYDKLAGTLAVSGTFWQATQPVSAASLPLPAGAATAAKQPALGTAGSASVDVLTVQGKSSMTPLLVDGSGVTQPVSAASLPLPAGAATAAKQPALGTAGSASADVLTVQGKASMTPLLVDGSGVTQPVSAASLPLPTGAATEASLGTDGATPPTIPGTGIRGWLRSIYDKLAGTLAVSGTFWQATQPVSAASLPLPAGAATAAKQPALGTAGSASADVLTVQGKASMTPLLVDGSGVTQPVSAASLPLPAGAATSAKQPALGTAGSASADVLTVQGKASMTPLLVDGSGVTQPVSVASLPALAAGTNLIGQTAASAETGTVYNGSTALTPKTAIIAVSATGTLVAAVTSKKIRVLSLWLTANGAVNAKFQSHVSPTDLTGLAYLNTNGFVLPFSPVGHFETVAGEALDINLSASVAVGGSLRYVEV